MRIVAKDETSAGSTDYSKAPVKLRQHVNFRAQLVPVFIGVLPVGISAEIKLAHPFS